MRTLYTRKCVTCEREFQTDLYNKATCSLDCAHDKNLKRRRELSARVHKVCPYCGDDYYTKHGNQPSCHKKTCRQQHGNKIKEMKSVDMSKKERRKELHRATHLAYNTNKQDCCQVVVNAVCPGCGKPHQKKMYVGYTGRGVPRINCIDYPSCMANGMLINTDGFSVVWEDNRSSYI